MSYTISNLKSEVNGILHGNSIDDVSDPFGVIGRAASAIQLDMDLFETKRTYQIVNGVYNDVYDYAVPSDLKMNKIIDISRQVNRGQNDNFSQTYTEQFDLNKSNNWFSVEYINGTKKIRLSKDVNAPVIVTQCNGVTNDDGTWSTGGDADNLVADSVNYITGSASLRFDLDGSTTSGYLQNSTLTAVDLSAYEDKSAMFVWVYIPDTTIFTSVALRWGSGSSDYWTVTSTSQHFGSFQNGWNLIRFDWNGATEVGTPVSSAVDFVRITLTYDGTADTDYRIDKLTSNLGELFNFTYYSSSMFTDSTGATFKDYPTVDEDIILLETTSRNLLVYKVAEFAAQQIQEQGGSIDVQYFSQSYLNAKSIYKKSYKSEAIKPQVYYYRPQKNR